MRETKGERAGVTASITPSLDCLFDLLSESRRRYALYHLNDQPDGVATIEDLTENVIALEEATETGDANGDRTASEAPAVNSADRRSGVQLELQHVHLPKLEDAGILEHDRRSETVRYWSQPSLEEWLEHAQYKEIE
jgi:DNA-binding transcriptional ArsR family regulator